MTATQSPDVPEAAASATPPARLARTGHPFRAELRRSLAPWAGLAMAAMLLVALFAKAGRWQGSWGETQAMLHAATALIGGPLAVACGCWHGGRERRRGTAELRASAARASLAQCLVAVSPLVLCVAAGYALAAVAPLLATWPYTSTGHPLPSRMATDLVFLAAAVIVGYVVGRLVPWRLTAPALSAFAYVALGAPGYTSWNVRWLSPAEAAYTGGQLPVWWQAPAMMLWTGGLGAAALLAYAARRRITALLPLAVATAAAVAIVQSGDGMWRWDPALDRQVCDDSFPQVCVNSTRAKLLPQVSQALSGITSRLQGVEGVPVRFEDRAGEPKPDEVQLPMLMPLGQSVLRGRLTDPQQYAWEAAAALTWRDCDDAGAERLRELDSAVREWLAAVPWHTDAFGTPKLLPRLTAMGDEERRAWLGRYFATRGACDPRKVPAL
ncbi:hypothetical protein [Streptomyces sp. SYSU K21746]